MIGDEANRNRHAFINGFLAGTLPCYLADIYVTFKCGDNAKPPCQITDELKAFGKANLIILILILLAKLQGRCCGNNSTARSLLNGAATGFISINVAALLSVIVTYALDEGTPTLKSLNTAALIPEGCIFLLCLASRLFLKDTQEPAPERTEPRPDPAFNA